MLEQTRRQQWLKFILGIMLPTLLAIVIAIGSIYLVIIPSFEKSFLESKREMIRELSKVAWGILAFYEKQEHAGNLTTEQAQSRAIEEIGHLRYGDESRDYFWISDMSPKLLMHPYSKELVGADLSSYEDSTGKRLFMEIIATVSDRQSGFVDYIWSKKYETSQEVPKLSYVIKFEPWGWIVGTGVYLDDVEAKTVEITARLTRMIYATGIAFTLLLLYVTHHSLIIERKRRLAEERLELSRKKYKTLAESAVDPIMMIHNGSCIYANKSMERLVGYTAAELEAMPLIDLFPKGSAAGEGVRTGGGQAFMDAVHGYVLLGPQEASLVTKNGDEVDVQMTMSRRNLGSQKVVVMTVRDQRGTRQIEEALDESREKYRLLTNRLRIGVFRTKAEGSFKFLEGNHVVLELLGVDSEAALTELSLLEVMSQDPKDRKLTDLLKDQGFVKEQLFTLKGRDGEDRMVSVSMVLTKNSRGKPLYCDGLIEDVSKQQKSAREREDLIVELQTSILFLNQPVRNALTGFVSCSADDSILSAAQLMTAAHKSAILVRNEDDEMIGIVTDMALRERVVVENLPVDSPVREVMSSPLIHIEDSALIFEAVLLLQEKNIKHLAVRDGSGAVISVISNEELLDVHRYSAAFLLKEIREAASVEEIAKSRERLPRIVKALIDSGAHAENITRIITNVSDAILGRLIEFALAQTGEPPVRFAFISLGSEGRGEQTLVTDQDNALIFEDVGDDISASIHAYFHQFSETVCTWLDQVGYAFCNGKVMAMNPKWCQPISQWKKYFSAWITESSPEDLMEVSIFFDFRCLYGDHGFVDELREHIAGRTENKAAFLFQLAQNTLSFKVPIDFFGKIAVESGGDHPNTFNVKHVITQIVSFARIYAINYSLESTNTLKRIDILLEKKVLNKVTHDEIVEAYNYLMQLRFRHQVGMIDRGEPPDNHVNINELTHMEKELFERIFNHVNQLRKRLNLAGINEIYF